MALKHLIVLLAFTTAGLSQVSLVTFTGGSGYTSAPTLTASGGGCVTQPTFTTAVNAAVVNAVTVTYAGTGCTSAPTLAFSGGGGSGATATAVLSAYSQVLLTSVPSCSGESIQPCIGGAFTAYQYECILTVPPQRTKYYANGAGSYTMPDTSQASKFQPVSVIPAATMANLSNGVITIYSHTFIVASSVTLASVESQITTACTTAQTNLNNWNPWVNYSTFYNFLTSTWTSLGAQ